MNKKVNKYIDLSGLPTYYKGIDWKNSLGVKCNFIYGDISGEIEIIDHTNKYVTIKFKDKIDRITTGSFISCSIGNILGIRTNDFKIEIGTTFNSEKRNITVIDREYRADRNGREWKFYKYKCNVCTWDNGWMSENNILNDIGCSCCYGRTTVRHINDVSTTHPEYLKYFVDINDAYTHSFSSTDIVNLKCPICGEEKFITLNQFHRYGLACGICSDGISYGEKFIHSLLKQLNVNFIKEYSKTNVSWCNDYRYDFYLSDYNTIIEVQGGQHSETGNSRWGFKSLAEEQENDKLKKELAIKNNINHYIEIDCHRSAFDIITESILNSELPKILNFQKYDVDLTLCEKYASSSLVKEVCDYKNNHEEMSTTEIAKVFGMNRTTIQIYLQRGAIAGFCIYDKELENKRKYARALETRMQNNKSKVS